MRMSTPLNHRAAAQTLRRVVVVAAFALLLFGAVAQGSAAQYNPEAVISNANMRDADAMSQAEIQAFLETQSGILAALVTTDYAGHKKPASQIIFEACQEWTISPKVMLTMLQKEQSLLTRLTLGPKTLSRAIGAGCPNATTNRYPGFGRQMWHGARLFDGYGEGKNGSTIPLFYDGIAKTIYPIDGMKHVHPDNLATYKLYVYNPSVGAKKPYGDLTGANNAGHTTGNANFWLIYRRYFGGTYTDPRMRHVYRFRNKKNGTYLYTASVTERYHIVSKHSTAWAYEGSPFSVDTSVSAASTVPVYRFYNRKTAK